ncbi:YoaK family protein [Pedobacter sp.]|uniref:YoaK family protein n=1 Tax=Pedobacter sp. TaxID=1411316 RepID=UPI0031D6C0D8
MLRHLGAKRTPGHNLKLATLLGLTAGFVNAAGFLAYSVLTTNVTGHAALFAEHIATQDWKTAQVIALWMFLFLAGAFFSSLVLTYTGPNQRFSYSIPILVEIVVLLFSAIYGNRYDATLVSKEIFAGSLLFAMGLQNALVSMISGSVVRTTHLTGTFTDLGIELAQLIKRNENDRTVVKSKIKLRVVIIFFFMMGAIVGAYLFSHYRFKSFFVPIFVLCYALLYDIFRIKIKRFYQKQILR